MCKKLMSIFCGRIFFSVKVMGKKELRPYAITRLQIVAERQGKGQGFK